MKLKKILFIWLCILSYSNMPSQNYFRIYDSIYKKEPRKINEIFTDSLLIISHKKTLSIQKISHHYSILMYKKRFFLKAIKYAKIEIESFEKAKVVNANYTNALYNLGRFYIINLQYKEAIKNFEKVIEINNNIKKSGESYCEIGRSYRKINKLHESVNYYKKGILILENLKEYKSLFDQYINLAVTFDNLNNENSLNNALHYREKAKSILKFNKKIRTSSIYGLNAGLANYYNTKLKYNFKKSKEYYLKNLKASLKENDNKVIVNSYINLGDLYLKEKRDSAFYFLNKGLEYSKSSKLSKAELYRNLALYHKNKEEYTISLENINKSIFSLTEDESYLEEVKDKKLLLSALKNKIEILLSQNSKTGNKESLKKANKTINTADRLIDVIQKNNLTEINSKLFWRKEASEVYLKGVYISYLLKDTEKSFYFIEKNKALLLTQSIVKNTEQQNLPKNISTKENQLKKNILTLENKLKLKNQDLLQDSLFNLKQVHQKYTDSIRILYPKHFENQLEIDQIKLFKVQENLGKNEVIVSYIWNKFEDEKELVFGQLITKNTTEIFKIDSIDVFKARIKKYRELISKPFDRAQQQEQFKKVSYNLFKQVFPNKSIRGFLSHKNIVILADGDLQSIPFDALITKENTFDYLLKSCNISYGNSMSFLNYNKKIKRQTTNNYIGYSPVSFKNKNLEKLKKSEKEIISIQHKIGGTNRLNSSATKKHFLSESGSSKIIHLATHADASNNPWIAFSDENLELHELYTYKNNADLVVLSACNTSLGEVAKGEGVLSLARGFFYSGAKSVISSLWHVNDKSTSFIMTDFYENLKSGQTKSLALANAKRNYLKTHSLSELSPYYWSSFILIGDTDTIGIANNNSIFIAVFLILITSLFFFFKIKVKN